MEQDRIAAQKKAAELRTSGIALSRDVVYHGGYTSGFRERATMWSFFTQFRDIIFKPTGSIIGSCWLEVTVCTTLGVVARLYFYDEHDEYSPIGHQLVGTLLAFLVVFRSQSTLNAALKL